MARVPLIVEQDHPELAEVVAKYSTGRRGKLINVYRMLLHSPDLAESWFVSRDGLVYTFLLRQGLRWDDGQPLTARDVVFSAGRAASVVSSALRVGLPLRE